MKKRLPVLLILVFLFTQTIPGQQFEVPDTDGTRIMGTSSWF